MSALKKIKHKMRLPNKPSKLIRVALHDLEEVEKNPAYKVNMYRWHYVSALDSKCHVCLAGSVIACRSGIIPSKSLGIDCQLPCENKMYALDHFRRGHVKTGLKELGLELPGTMFPYYEVPFYKTNPFGFKTALLAVATALEKAGL